MVGILMIIQHCVTCSSVRSSFTQLAILVSCLCSAGVLTQDYKTTCNAPSVKPLEEAVLTCHFPEDLGVSKKDFTVYHYDKSGSPEAVIDCWWINGKLDCYAKPSIEYNKTVGTGLTIIFKRLTSALTGKYTCQAAGYGPGATEPCEVQFQLERETLCKIDYNISESKAVLTCFFNEDVANTRRNFTVYKHSGQDRKTVVECSWEDGQKGCRVENGYKYNDEVSTYLFLDITEVTKNTEENYSCWHSNIESVQPKTCSFPVADKVLGERTRDEGQSFNTLAIDLALGLLALALLVACGIFLLRNKVKIRHRIFKRKSRLAQPDVEEGQQMIDDKENTRMFEEFLESTVQRMYPNMLESFYFVPPLYFNKSRYKTQRVADQIVYVSHPSDLSDIRHDQAMQRVLQCLCQMAEHEQEHMFVLTQFRYEDYLNNPGGDFKRHCLPLPSDLVGEDEGVGCFDFLIVHQTRGVLVGVVKAVSDEDQIDQQTTSLVVSEQRRGVDFIVSQVAEAVQQLEKAVHMINHVMSDHKPFPRVRQTLMLPRLKRETFRSAIATNSELVKKLRYCLESTDDEDPADSCLFAEDLSDTKRYNVINSIQQRWRWLVTIQQEGIGDAIMTPDLYLSMIARFFGPATQSTLQVPDGCERFVLTKTLAEAVSLTGDLYKRLMLNQDMIELLDKPILFLGGPPNSGKTRMLTLAGNKWLCEGHDVFIVNDASSKSFPILSHQLKALTAVDEKDLINNSTRGCIYDHECDFTSDRSLKRSIEEMITKATGKGLCVLVDGAHLNGEKAKKMWEIISSRAPGLHMWVSCSPEEMFPASIPHKILDNRLCCPPAIIRRIAKESREYANTHDTSDFPVPTDGPAVMDIFHKYSFKPWSPPPHNCVECGLEVGSFLTKHLLISKANKVTNKTQKSNSLTGKDVTDSAIQETEKLYLQFNDILILFEGSGNIKDYGFLTGLRKSGVIVHDVTDRSNFDVEHGDCAWAMNIDHLVKYRTKRKIVVYVDKNSEYQNEENKVLAFSHCTSQLVVVNRKPK